MKKDSVIFKLSEGWLGVDVLRNAVGGLGSPDGFTMLLTLVLIIPLAYYLYANWRYREQKLFSLNLKAKSQTPKLTRIAGKTFLILYPILVIIGLLSGMGSLALFGIVTVLVGFYYYRRTIGRFKV